MKFSDVIQSYISMNYRVGCSALASVLHSFYYLNSQLHFQSIQDAQLLQRDRAAGCVIVFAKSRTLELRDNILRTL